MRRITIFLLVVSACFGKSIGQSDTVTLIQCLVTAREHAALNPQLNILNNISDLKISNAESTNLPSVSAYGKAWYQSDAIAVPGPSGIEIDKLQYNFGIEADQKIFDGGMASRTKELETASTTAEKNKVETDLYQLNNEVIRYFFSYNLFKKSKKVLELKTDVLNKRIKEMESGVRNGMVKRNDLDQLTAELMLTKQQLLDVESKCSQSLNGLGMLTGFEMAENPELIVPDSLINMVNGVRPEYTYFDAEKNRLDKTIKLKSGVNLPKLYSYGQLGYTYPGLNFFENQPDYYYIVGAKLSWTIYDWSQIKREKKILMKQKEIIDTRKTDFDRNMGLQIENEQLEEEKLLSVIELDEQIINQRASITNGSSVSMMNGVITSSLYIDDLNAEMKARIDLETHKIQYMYSIVKVYLLKGINVENQ
jgi:outer membrane protein TolC